MRPNPRNEKDETPAEKSAREQREAEQKRLADEKAESAREQREAEQKRLADEKAESARIASKNR